jgi:hypothetical protein
MVRIVMQITDRAFEKAQLTDLCASGRARLINCHFLKESSQRTNFSLVKQRLCSKCGSQLCKLTKKNDVDNWWLDQDAEFGSWGRMHNKKEEIGED